METSFSFKLYDLNNPQNTSGNKYTKTQTITKITDISKHIIIVFESSIPAGYNYQVYEEFNYMLSKIVYDVKLLNGGYLPKINLIGHSRGGLTNLEYVLDHPLMIGSVFSIGTPYFGSDTASTSIGEIIANECDGLHDIINRNIYINYYNRWAAYYETLYSNIDYHALGGYSDSDFVLQTIRNYAVEENNNDLSNIVTVVELLIRAWPVFVEIIEDATELYDFWASIIDDAELIEDYFGQDLVEAASVFLDDVQYVYTDESAFFLEIIADIIIQLTPILGHHYYLNDLLVDLTSQLGYDEHGSNQVSYGFKTHKRCYRMEDYWSENKKVSMVDLPAVAHNLEARDIDLINYIITKIPLGISDAYVYDIISNSTAKFVGYRGELVFSEFSIPSEINGYTITEISTNVFHDEGGEIITITIPSTVINISDEAFMGMTNLEEVIIDDYSCLFNIGNMAFAGCTNLSKFGYENDDDLTFPTYVTNVGEYAFYGTSFDTINVNEYIEMIGESAFANIDVLNCINVDNYNTDYYSINGVLFSYDDALIQYPIAKNIQTYSIPSYISEISDNAFKNATNLTSINFGSVESIGNYSFSGCDSLEVVYMPDTITEIGLAAFENCSNIYTVSFSYNLVTIGDFAFKGCTSLFWIEIPSSVQEIGDEAFCDCTSLETISIFRGVAPITAIGLGTFANCDSNLEIEVPINRIADYKNKAKWKLYKPIIVPSSNNYTSYLLTNSTNESISISINSGYNKIYELDVANQNVYTIFSSTNNVIIKLYDSNMNRMSLSSSAITKTFNNASTYYFTIEHQSLESSGIINCNIIKDDNHNHNYVYEWDNNIRHKKTCGCDHTGYEPHVLPANAFNNGQLFAFCLRCNGRVMIGVIYDNLNNLLSTSNGSFILPNGIVVLVEEDYEEYLNGTIVFEYHNNDMLD